MSGVDADTLRMFFLSMLWRAAETNLSEFSEIKLEEQQLAKLREMVLDGLVAPYDFFPVTLTRLSTRGIPHNHTAIAQIKTNPAVGNHPAQDIPIFRFYFDGLVAHLDRRQKIEPTVKEMGSFYVGGQDKLLVSTVAFESSFQKDNLSQIMRETYSLPPRG